MMAVLYLENVPDDLVREIEQLAERERQTPAAKAVSLLREALGRGRTTPVAEAQGSVREILDRMAASRMRPDPDGPSVLEMVREDRER